MCAVRACVCADDVHWTVLRYHLVPTRLRALVLMCMRACAARVSAWRDATNGGGQHGEVCEYASEREAGCRERARVAGGNGLGDGLAERAAAQAAAAKLPRE